MREVSGDSQESMLVLGEWVTERRSKQSRSRFRGADEFSLVHSGSGVYTEMGLSLTWEGVCCPAPG